MPRDLGDIEHVSSEEVGQLMAQLQELLEARVVAMILQHPSGDVSLSLASDNQELRAALLRQLPPMDEMLRRAGL